MAKAKEQKQSNHVVIDFEINEIQKDGVVVNKNIQQHAHVQKSKFDLNVGMDEVLENLSVGDTGEHEIFIPKEKEPFGKYNPQLVKELQVGIEIGLMTFLEETGENRIRPARILSADNGIVIIDLNPPLSNGDLTIKIDVKEVRLMTDEEELEYLEKEDSHITKNTN